MLILIALLLAVIAYAVAPEIMRPLIGGVAKIMLACVVMVTLYMKDAA